jgi:hypothetical protein
MYKYLSVGRFGLFYKYREKLCVLCYKRYWIEVCFFVLKIRVEVEYDFSELKIDVELTRIF